MDNAHLSSWLLAALLVGALAVGSMIVTPDMMPRLALYDPGRRAPLELLPSTPSRVPETELPLIEH